MARDGSGNYTLPLSNVVADTTILASWANTTLSDVAVAMTGSMARNGTSAATGSFPMAGFKLTNVGLATTLTDYARASQVVDGLLQYMTGLSGTNNIAATAPLSVAAYVAGQRFSFKAIATNTAATTININTIGAKNIKKNGAVALSAGDILIGSIVEIVYDGTNFQLVNPVVNSGAINFTSGDRLVWSGTLPTGWTRDSTNNKAIRIVSAGTPGADGGSVAFTTAFASKAVSGAIANTTLSATQTGVAAHTHTGYTIPSANGSAVGGNNARVTSYNGGGTTSTTAVTEAAFAGVGASVGHNHAFNGTAINLAVQYTNMNCMTKT